MSSPKLFYFTSWTKQVLTRLVAHYSSSPAPILILFSVIQFIGLSLYLLASFLRVFPSSTLHYWHSLRVFTDDHFRLFLLLLYGVYEYPPNHNYCTLVLYKFPFSSANLSCSHLPALCICCVFFLLSSMTKTANQYCAFQLYSFFRVSFDFCPIYSLYH